MFGLIAGIASGAWRVTKGVMNIRVLIKEIKDVVDLARELWSKYDDLDDDAKRIAKELNDVVVRVKAILGV